MPSPLSGHFRPVRPATGVPTLERSSWKSASFPGATPAGADRRGRIGKRPRQMADRSGIYNGRKNHERDRHQSQGPLLHKLGRTLYAESANIISEELARRLQVVPLFKIDNIVTVAMVNPLDVYIIDTLSKTTGFRIDPVVCMRSTIFRDHQQALWRMGRIHSRRFPGSADGIARRQAMGIPAASTEKRQDCRHEWDGNAVHRPR